MRHLSALALVSSFTLACGPISLDPADTAEAAVEPDPGSEPGVYVPREGKWEFTPLADDDPCLVVAQSPVPWEVSVDDADADGFTMSGVACVLDGEAYSCEAHEASTEAGG